LTRYLFWEYLDNRFGNGYLYWFRSVFDGEFEAEKQLAGRPLDPSHSSPPTSSVGVICNFQVSFLPDRAWA
jgi:hypothetical protein